MGDKKNTFIALSFDGAGADQLKYTKLINDSCNSYKAKVKKFYNKFNEIANKLEADNKKHQKELDDLQKEKKILVDKLTADKKDTDKSKKELEAKKTMLVRSYTDLNNAKESKAKNDQLLEQLNKKLADIEKQANTKKNQFDATDKDKDQKRKELDTKNKQVNKTQTSLEKLEEEMKKLTDLI